MILYTLHMQAARYDRTIEPLLCMSIDFYVRLFVRIGYGSAKAQSQLGPCCFLVGSIEFVERWCFRGYRASVQLFLLHFVLLSTVWTSIAG